MTANSKEMVGVQLFLLMIVIVLGVMGVGLMGAAVLTFFGKDAFFRHRSPR